VQLLTESPIIKTSRPTYASPNASIFARESATHNNLLSMTSERSFSNLTKANVTLMQMDPNKPMMTNTEMTNFSTEDEIIGSVMQTDSMGVFSCPLGFVDTEAKKTVRNWCKSDKRARRLAATFNVTESFRLWIKLSPVYGKDALCRKLKWEKKNCK